MSAVRQAGDAWLAELHLHEGDQVHTLRVAVADTQRCIAGLIEPTADWIVKRARARARARLRNDRPLFDQIRAWREPLRLYAEPR